MQIRIKKLHPNARLPKRASEGAAGCDLAACLDSPVVLAPMERALIPTGLAVELSDSGYGLFVFSRSGLSLREGIAAVNGVGVVDSDYRGELCVPLINFSDREYTVQNGDRIAQIVVMPVEQPEFSWVETLDETVRGAGGFGSTGK
jgi:dUTP pyrophosphatase